MKKQVFAFMACAAIMAPTAGFCMENEGDFQNPRTKKVNLNIRYLSDCSTGAAPSRIKKAFISYTSGENSRCLGRYSDVGERVTSSQKKEVYLPFEGDTVKFSFLCTLEPKYKASYQREEDEFTGDFYDGVALAESNKWIAEIPQSSLLDGSTLELEFKACGAVREKKGLYCTPAYGISGHLWMSSKK